MRICVKLFASVREIVGRREVVMEVPAGLRVSALVPLLVSDYPKLHAQTSFLKIAVNQEYADGERILSEGDEVALIPPVSGGADVFEITEAPLSLDALALLVAHTTSGAVASFLGVVRRYARGREVDYLEYDAYAEMAVAKMRQVGDEIRRRWPVDSVAIVHRVGRLTVSDASVAIAVASPHRHEALQACAYAIERLKEIVPIWKKEVWSDGAEWIGSTVDEYRMGSGGSGRETGMGTQLRAADSRPPDPDPA